MRHRLFFAINLDEVLARKIARAMEEVERDLPPNLRAAARFVSSSNWHLTVSFLGYQDDAHFPAILEAGKRTALKFGPREIDLERITYAPSRGPSRRMIWAEARKDVSIWLGEMRNSLEKELFERGVPFAPERRRMDAHLTLARFTREVDASGLPPIPHAIHGRFLARKLDLMESILERDGAEYTAIQGFSLKNGGVVY